jgi:hypothetical protein
MKIGSGKRMEEYLQNFAARGPQNQVPGGNSLQFYFSPRNFLLKVAKLVQQIPPTLDATVGPTAIRERR